MAHLLENIYHHRRVAETSTKSCWICYKPTSSVLITPDNKDYFYICPSHLKDRNFALPDADEAKIIEERKKKEQMDREVEAVKKEYEERMKKKKEKRKGKKEDEKKKEDKKEEEESDKADEKDRDEKIKALTDKKDEAVKIEDSPRIFRLQKYVYST